jgi:hypothetical protein
MKLFFTEFYVIIKGISAIKAKTDNLPSDPAKESTSQEIKTNTDLIPGGL